MHIFYLSKLSSFLVNNNQNWLLKFFLGKEHNGQSPGDPKCPSTIGLQQKGQSKIEAAFIPGLTRFGLEEEGHFKDRNGAKDKGASSFERR